MSMMKTSLTIIPMCPRECFPLYKSLSQLVLCYKKDWAILLHFIYTCYLLPVTNYLITKLSVTDNFNACREIPYWKPLVISFCSSLGSTLLLIERTTIDPLHLWVIKRRGPLWFDGSLLLEGGALWFDCSYKCAEDLIEEEQRTVWYTQVFH